MRYPGSKPADTGMFCRPEEVFLNFFLFSYVLDHKDISCLVSGQTAEIDFKDHLMFTPGISFTCNFPFPDNRYKQVRLKTFQQEAGFDVKGICPINPNNIFHRLVPVFDLQ